MCHQYFSHEWISTTMLSEQALELIDIVARVGSFTAAANRLHKVPS
ncbi:MAG: LysR family transcriptional regulator, partial [Shewanella sp.]